MAATLTDGQRATLALLADALIPGGEGMPSATDAGVPTRWIDRALDSRPDLAATFAETLVAAAGADPAAYLAQLETVDHPRLEAFQLLVVGAYFMSPRTRKVLGYPGQKQDPVTPGEAEYYRPHELLADVRARGTVYRAVD